MPSMDRHWRLWHGILLSVFALMVFVALPGTMIAGHFVGLSPLDALGLLSWSDLSPILFLAVSVWFTSSSAKEARQRLRLRALALAGESDAMLPARTAPPREGDLLPDLAREPFSLIWRTKNGPRGVIATSEGLVLRIPRKPDRLVLWSDARLFEFWRFSYSKQYGYALFDGTGGLVEWYNFRPSKSRRADSGDALVEWRRRERLLIALITARTGLQPRTFVPDLAAETGGLPADSVAPRASTRRHRFWVTLLALLLVALPFGVAAGAIGLPLTRSVPLNLYVAATMSVLGLFLLGVALRGIATRWRMRRQGVPAQPPFVVLPSVPPEWAARMRNAVLQEPRGVKGRLLAGVIGALLIGDGYAVLRSSLDFAMPSNTPLVSFGGLQSIVAYALGSVSLVGLVISCAVLFAKRTALTVGEDGLRERRGKRTTTLAWDAVTSFSAHVTMETVVKFSLANADLGDDATSITWGAKWRWHPRLPAAAPGSDAAELAALVAQRTGLALSVEEEG